MDSILLFSAQALGILVTASTGSGGASFALPQAGDTLHLMNTSTSDAYISVGQGAQTATLPSSVAAATCTCIFGRSDVPFRIPRNNNLQIAALTSGGTAALNIYIGEGQ